MTAELSSYAWLDDVVDTESLAIVIVRGATTASVASALGVDLASEAEESPGDDLSERPWLAIGELPDGVVVLEVSGYQEPDADLLAALSANGRRAACVRSNIQAHVRFGCAQDGTSIFDDDEFAFTADRDGVPPELRTWLDLVWVDPDSADDGADDEPGDLPWFEAGLAMVEGWTGIHLTAEVVESVRAGGFRPGGSARPA